jgi:transposase
MLKGFTPEKIYLATGYTDLRKGIDGLAGIVQEQFQLDAFSDALFLFCGRRSDRIKGLYWDSNGFIMLYKRLESGSFRWPRTTQEAIQITAKQYEWLCQGFEIEPRNRPVKTDGLKFS